MNEDKPAYTAAQPGAGSAGILPARSRFWLPKRRQDAGAPGATPQIDLWL